MKKNKRRIIAALCAAATAVAILVGSTGMAQAWSTYQVTGQANTDKNVAIQYSTYRAHSAYGPIVFYLSDDISGSGVRFNLRSQSSGNFTGWSDYLVKNQQEQWTSVLVGYYAFKVQRQSSCSWFCDTNWGGSYTT